ncbi:DNA topoisomerase IV subunit A [Pseudaquidulcibacter saccharophilus]|uniref:DNA topoisomerase IV subunit A n=1 Tax=Pseudaquidulcibacter saccharophilus TaxID=2831900 RepID=UPI001EFEF290|nr:DNA topoisomerase IV subunit A [Pseudaquidulcibacter saccharophilus]
MTDNSDLIEPTEGGKIINEPFDRALESRYLVYALSTITSRALPDVRDGLKPVQRRIVHAMGELGLDSDARFKKCAKIVGDVMGKFHPHGDSAIYDTMVRLAQDFSVRYRLVDGQGNFGNIDGDSAAAYRYTEARLTNTGTLLLEGINEDCVNFRETYSGEDLEPVVLPASFPNLLANGAMGIAVGMATSIPPHNAIELIDACLALVDDHDLSTEAIMDYIPGPDFPTGGVIVEPKENILNAYETGKGSIRVRSKWHVEDMGRGQWQIIVTEPPFQVQKSRLIEKLAELIENKRAPLLADVRDESAEDIRIVLEPKSKTVTPEHLMESLFKLSDLENRFSVNLNVIDANGIPRVMGVKECLFSFITFKKELVVRRANWRRGKIEARLEILAALLIAYLNLDEVIRIIREEDDAKAVLMATFNLNDVQANAILDTRLRNLRKLEEMAIKTEDANLKKELDELNKLLASEKLQWRKVYNELEKTREIFAKDTISAKRRTSFADAPDPSTAISIEAFITKEPITVVLSKRGWIRALKGKIEDLSSVKFKDDDDLSLSLQCYTTDKIVLFATDGRAFTLQGDKLPSGRGLGEPIRLSIELGEEYDILDMFVPEDGKKRLVASSKGYGFVIDENEFLSQKRGGKTILSTGDNQKAAVTKVIKGNFLGVIGENRKLLIFNSEELPVMSRGKGVKLQSYRDGGILDAISFKGEDGLVWIDSSGRNREMPEWRDYVGKRASVGRMVPRGFSKTGKFS